MINKLDSTILKALISNKKFALEFVNDGDTKLFAPETWNFANLVISHIKLYKDIPTLRILIEKLKPGDKLADNIKNIWNEVEAIEFNEREYAFDLEKLKKRFAEKQILLIKDKLSSLDPGAIDVNKITSDLQKTTQSIKSLNQTKAFERKTLKDAVVDFKTEYNSRIKNPDFEAGIKTGYSFLDNSTDGLRNGELILIGGESGGGKSMLLMNMAIQLWMQKNTIDTPPEEFSKGYNVLYFSLEMPFKPCLNRVLSRLASVPSKLLKTAKLNKDDTGQLKKSLNFISKYPYNFEIIDIPRGATMESLELLFLDAKTQYNPDIVIIDYLGLMDYDGGKDMDDWLKLGKIAEKMHEFCRVHNTITLSAVQLNRIKPGKDAEEAIGLHRVGRSALILQNANIAIQLGKRKNEEQYMDMEYFLIKNRDGNLGKGYLLKNLAYGTLLDKSVEIDQNDFYSSDIDDISYDIEELDL